MAAQEQGAGGREQEDGPVNGVATPIPAASARANSSPMAVQPAHNEAGGSAGGDEETNVWPTEAEEAAFLSEASERGEKVVPVPREREEEIEDDSKALPKLDELVNRIPGETRELLDELFRARFVAVRRVKKKDLKG